MPYPKEINIWSEYSNYFKLIIIQYKTKLILSLCNIQSCNFKGIYNPDIRLKPYFIDVTSVFLVLHYKWKFSVLQQFSLISFRLPHARNITSVVNCSDIHKRGRGWTRSRSYPDERQTRRVCPWAGESRPFASVAAVLAGRVLFQTVANVSLGMFHDPLSCTNNYNLMHLRQVAERGGMRLHRGVSCDFQIAFLSSSPL